MSITEKQIKVSEYIDLIDIPVYIVGINKRSLSMITITQVMLDCIVDYKSKFGTPGSTPIMWYRWIGGKTTTIQEQMWEKIVEKMELKQADFETVVLVDDRLRGRLETELTCGATVPDIAAACDVSNETVEKWLKLPYREMRHGVYRRLCARFGWDLLDCISYKQADEEGQASVIRVKMGWAATMPTAALDALAVIDRGDYERLTGRAKKVTFEGKIRMIRNARGVAPGTVLTDVVRGVSSVVDGDHVAVKMGGEHVVGTIRFLPVLVVEDGAGPVQASIGASGISQSAPRSALEGKSPNAERSEDA